MLVLFLVNCVLLEATKPNVLYIISDDMRADVGAYFQQSPVQTPNLDELAKQSLLFQRAYCQLSVCAPSRMSFMHSRRPDTSQVWNFIDTLPLDTISVPRHFRDNGYLTLGLGKAFHQGNGSANSLGCWNAQNTWSNISGYPCFPYVGGQCPHGSEGGGHCVKKDSDIYDWHLKGETLAYLKHAAANHKQTGQPFFVVSGYRKPHAPWEAPQRCYDLYNVSSIPVAKNKVLPKNAPLVAWSQQLAVKLENGTTFPYSPHTPVPDWVAQDQRRAYYACVSYTDEHVGELLAALDETGVRNNTIVVFHADHGYHLGEHGEWEKKSNFDLVVRVPLMISVPWIVRSLGHRTMAIAELVDVGPTLTALAGLPPLPEADGNDLSQLFDDPTSSIKNYAFHQYPACGEPHDWNHTRTACNNVPRNQFWAMGYSVRSNNWRYTRWIKWNGTSLQGVWGDDDFAEELYNHIGDESNDLDKWENENVVTQQPEIAQQLYRVLRLFFDKTRE